MRVPSGNFRTILLLVLPALSAHELEVTVTLASPAVVTRAAYGGSEAVAFAKVQVFSPGSTAQEFQTGVTDRRGYFSFVPEGSGQWRIVVDDEEGHRRELEIPVPDNFAAHAQPAAAPVSRLERALTGLALIFGLTGFFYGFKARRPS